MEFHDVEKRLIDSVLGSPEYASKGFEWRMSKAGDCPRLMDLSIQKGSPSVDYYSAMRFKRGHALHDMWQAELKAALGHDYINAEEEVKLLIEVTDPADGEILRQELVGHHDGEIVSMDAIYELKNVSDATWMLVMSQAGPLPANYEQGNLYATAKGKKNILFHYYNTNDGRSQFFLVPANEQSKENTLAKFRDRLLNRKYGRVQERPYHDPTGSPCFFCSYKQDCYKDFRGEVEASGKAVLSPEEAPDLHEEASLACESRQDRLKAEKLEELHRAKLARNMIRRKLNSAMVGQFKVDVKVGTKGNPLVSIKAMK